MKITKEQIRSIIREALLNEVEDAADARDTATTMTRAIEKRKRENPRPEDFETWDQQKQRKGQATPTDTSPESQKMVGEVLSFLEGIGTPKQVGDRNRYTVEPIKGVELDFNVMTKKSGVKLIVTVSAVRDYLPQGSSDGEDIDFLAENMGKMSKLLMAIADSGLPIHTISFSTRT